MAENQVEYGLAVLFNKKHGESFEAVDLTSLDPFG